MANSSQVAALARCALTATSLCLQSRSTAILGDDELTEQVAPLPAHLLHNATRSESGHEFLGALNRSGACDCSFSNPSFRCCETHDLHCGLDPIRIQPCRANALQASQKPSAHCWQGHELA